VKKDERVFVCLGNPPYDLHDSSDDMGGWVVNGHDTSTPIWIDFVGEIRGTSSATDLKPTYNLYAYFWRWALWKVFEAHDDNPNGVVAFISASSFLQGPGFGGMRAHMRRLADQILVLDLGGEGHGSRRDDNGKEASCRW
jgi:predicted helicase